MHLAALEPTPAPAPTCSLRALPTAHTLPRNKPLLLARLPAGAVFGLGVGTLVVSFASRVGATPSVAAPATGRR